MKERAYWMSRVCSEAKHPQQLWRSLNTLMGASEKNNLLRNCLSAEEFADFFEAKVAAVRKATGNSAVSSELQPATEKFKFKFKVVVIYSMQHLFTLCCRTCQGLKLSFY